MFVSVERGETKPSGCRPKGRTPAPHALFTLQRSAGNAAVASLLRGRRPPESVQRSCTCAAGAPQCPTCAGADEEAAQQRPDASVQRSCSCSSAESACHKCASEQADSIGEDVTVEPAPVVVHRQADGDDDACPAYEPGEVRQSSTAAGHLDSDIWELDDRDLLVADFAVNWRRVKPATARDPVLRGWLSLFESDPQYRDFDIKGYDDCRGTPAIHDHLRKGRAHRVHALFGPSAKTRVTSVGAAPAGSYVAGNQSVGARAQNRGVRITFVRDETVNFAEDEVDPVRIPKFKCGPDVTTQIADAVTLTRSSFAGWDEDQRTEACEDLRSVRHGKYAWDIVQLHNQGWILDYRNDLCASKGATPVCGTTVEVGDQCYYAGSANYVIFGTMCRLCRNHFLDIGRAGSMPGYTGSMDFTEDSMLSLIDLYKSSSPNVGPSKAWSSAGFHGWPGGGSPPPGDRNHCEPECIAPYRGPAFLVNWYPHMFHTGK